MQENSKASNGQNLNQRAVKAGMWYIVSQILIRGISFLTTPFFSRVLSASAFGDAKTIESWLYVIAPILSLCIYESISRAKYDFSDEYDKYISSVVSISLISTTAVFLICLPFWNILKDLMNVSSFTLSVMFLYAITHPAVLCMQNREKQLLKYKSNILLSMLLVVPSTIISVVLLLIFKDSEYNLVDLRIIGLFLPQVIVGVFVIISLYRSGKSFVNIEHWKYALKFCVPLIPYSLASTILNQSDRIMVKYMIDSHEAGIFSLGVTLIYIIEVFGVAISSAFEPWLFENMNKKDCQHVQKAWSFIAIAFGVMTVGMTLFAPEIIWILGGNEYAASAYLIPPMLSGALMNFYCLVLIKIEYFHKKVKMVAIGTIATSVVNLILNYVCIVIFKSVIAPAYTTAFCYLLLLIIHSVFVAKIEKRKVISLKFTLILALSILGINLLIQLLYSSAIPSYFRYIIAVASVVISLCICKNKIFTFIQMAKDIFIKKK